MLEAVVSRILHHTLSISGWRELLDSVFDAYRPELHYMRGPGPKWRAKHLISSPQIGNQSFPIRRRHLYDG
jgi:hypothetical protein